MDVRTSLKLFLTLNLLLIQSCALDYIPATSPTLTPISLIANVTPSISTPSISTTNPVMSQTLPALSLREKQDIFRNFYETNGTCELPCLWGIVPGETSKDKLFT